MTGPVLVTALFVTAVKGTRLREVDAISLWLSGAQGDRRFFVIDERGRMVNAKTVGALQTVVADVADGSLRLLFPDGREVAGPVVLGDAVTTRFYSQPREARLVSGAFSSALSEHVGRAVRLVEPSSGAIDRGRVGGASLISRASLGALASAAGEEAVDARRFRMLVEVDGLDAHAEDRWVGRVVRIGQAEVRFRGHVGRCLITSRDPESGEIDLPTLDIIGDYRAGVKTTEPLPFGIYGEVVSEGLVRVGDAVAVSGD